MKDLCDKFESIPFDAAAKKEKEQAKILEWRRRYETTHRDLRRAYRENNRAILNAKKRARYKDNLESERSRRRVYYAGAGRDYFRKYREENKDKIREQKRQYRERNKSRLADTTSAYYANNKQKISDRSKLRYAKVRVTRQEQERQRRRDPVQHAKRLDVEAKYRKRNRKAIAERKAKECQELTPAYVRRTCRKLGLYAADVSKEIECLQRVILQIKRKNRKDQQNESHQ